MGSDISASQEVVRFACAKQNMVPRFFSKGVMLKIPIAHFKNRNASKLRVSYTIGITGALPFTENDYWALSS